MSFPKYWTWTKCTPQKIVSFWSNPYKIVVILTSLTEMLELLNFVYMTTSTIWFKSRDKMLFGDIVGKSYDVITFISNYLYFKKA